MKLPANVIVKEVGPRDGLQNESAVIRTEDKIAWINQLSRTGLSYIEYSSYVSPQWIPALADAEQVAKGIERAVGVTYAALVPNPIGLERALSGGVDEVSVFVSASETHNRKNMNKSIDQTLPLLAEVTNGALRAGKSVRGYISVVFGCPYEGTVEPRKVMQLMDALFEMGIGEVSLGDTIGAAHPVQVERMLDIMLERYPSGSIAMHFHDTRGMALANIVTSLRCGITKFDASAGGLGGCPYAPGAAGNAATEDVVYMLHAMGVQTGIHLSDLLAASRYIQDKLGRTLPSRNLQAGLR